MVSKTTPEPPKEEAPAKPEPKKAAVLKGEPGPEVQVHAGGHVLTEDKGWMPEEEK